MFRALRVVAIGAAATFALCGSSCGGNTGTDRPNSGSTATVAAVISYDTFLAVLAENGWVPNEDQKLVGGVDKGVEVTVLRCHTRLGLIDPTKTDFHVTSINGYGPDYYGETAEQQLSPSNITRSDYEKALYTLTDEGIIPPC